MPSVFTILIDYDCPLCKREANLLQRLDKQSGNLKLVNIAAADFDASAFGTTFEAVMGHIHGITAEGKLITGMEVFRRAYTAVGMPWLLNWTRWPVARPIADAGYRLFAKYRLRLPGRTTSCTTQRCHVPS